MGTLDIHGKAASRAFQKIKLPAIRALFLDE